VFSLWYWTRIFEDLTCLLGGRQVDGAISSLLALATIMQSPLVKEAQQAGKLTVLFDSGIRTGSDIFKAIALGAQAVLSAFCFNGVITES